MNRSTLWKLLGLMLALACAFAVAYTQRSSPSREEVAPSVLNSIAFVAWAVGVGSFFAAVLSFRRILSQHNPGISLRDARPFEMFFVLSNRYLNPLGRKHRNRLLVWLATFLTSCVVGAGALALRGVGV